MKAMGVILMKMAVLLEGNAFCVDGHRDIAGFSGDPILSTQIIPRSGDPIVSAQRIPRGGNRRGATLYKMAVFKG